MTLPELAIRRPITATVLLVSVFVIGLIALLDLPLAFLPDIQERRIFVIVRYPNASPKTVERMIVKPLEEHLSSVEGLERMWSQCDANGGRVSMNFNWDADMGVIRAEIRERVDRARAELPEDVETIQLATDYNPQISGETIIEGRISSGLDLSKNYHLLERKIIKPLERVPGVASVSLDGVNPREVKVNLNLDALRRHNVTAAQITDALYANNQDRSLGVVRNTQQQFMLRSVGSFRDIESIKRLPIPSTSLYLEDLAEITYKEPPLEYGRHLDGQFAVGVSVSQESNANTVEVSRMVRERVAEMQDDPELEGINFLVWEDQGAEILKTIRELEQTGLIGGLLASIILLIFLKRFSTTFIAVASIPFSLIVACGVIWAQGKNLNTISLMGLIVGIGMLVDNAVVIMENIDRYQRRGYRSKVAALLGSREVSVAVIAATLTSIIVFLPIFFSKPSRMNIILNELAITITITLLASLFISQTLIPLCVGNFTKSKQRGRGRIMAFLRRHYEASLAFFLKRRWMAPILGLLVTLSVIYPFQRIDMNFSANESEMFVGMFYRFSEDLPLDRKEEIVSIVEETLAPYKEELGFKSIYSWYAERMCLTRLYMEEGNANEAKMNEIRKRLPALLPSIPGVKVVVNSGGRPWQRNSGKRVAFQLQGPEMEPLAELADEAKDLLTQIDGLFDIYSDAEGGSSELHARVDREKARAYNVDIQQPARAVELTFRGRRLPRYKDPLGEVEMRMTLDEKEEETVDQLKNLSLQSGGGASVPLESFASFAVVKGPDNIRRENKATSVWVGGRYSDGIKEEYRKQGEELLMAMNLPYGYRWNFGAGFEDENASKKEFQTNLLLALLLIFAVMAALFESVSQAVSLLISLPLAITGALWTLYLFNVDLDQPAAIGVLLLLGIVVNNGIVLIEHVNGYRRQGLSRTKAILRGAPERLQPVLITAMTTIFGLVPIIIQKPSLGGTYYYSMAYVIIGGLIMSTALTMFILPTIDCLVEDTVAWFKRLGRFFKRTPQELTEPETA